MPNASPRWNAFFKRMHRNNQRHVWMQYSSFASSFAGHLRLRRCIRDLSCNHALDRRPSDALRVPEMDEEYWRVHQLLADVAGTHRREDNPIWWRFAQNWSASS